MRVRVVDGDLLDQQVEVIVNAWNRNLIPWWLLIPQGVSGAIKRRGGYAPFRELGYRPLPLGTARLTNAGTLPFRAIIHVAGIDGLWRASAASVAQSVRSALLLAHENGFRSIALPILGAGSGGLTAAVAERTMLGTLAELADAIDMEVLVVRFRR